MPCVCMDKYHMAQNGLYNNELCSVLLDKVYDSLGFISTFFKQPCCHLAFVTIV